MTTPQHKIVKGYIVESKDNGRTWKALRKATTEEVSDYNKSIAAKPVVKDSTVKPNTVSNETESKVPLLITPYGYGTDKLHASKYDAAQWKKWAEETGFTPTRRTVAGQNKEFQEYLLNDDKFKDKVKKIHEELGMPYAGYPEDSYLGERWDKIMEKLTAKPAESPQIKIPAEDKPEETVREEIKRYPPVAKNTGDYAPWWLQDIIKTAGSAADLARIHKYEPWQATPEVFLPEGTFYDPTRELAANTEAANLAMQTNQAFTNPQQQAAANSMAQGQMAKAAADVMAKYNNLNVGLANQLAQQNASIMNAASQNKANLDTQLYDKYTVANQQFDNAKAMGRQALRQNVIDAVTNRAKTQALNTLDPNYYTDPSKGGFVNFLPGNYTPTPTSGGTDLSKEFAEAVKVTGSKDAAMEYLKLKYNIKNPPASQGNSYYNPYEG
jgi:hypothetical protein